MMQMAARKTGQSLPPKKIDWQEQAAGKRLAKLNESKAAYKRVQEATADLPKVLKKKCVAIDGGKTMSGFKGNNPRKLPQGYLEATPNQIKAHSKKIGHDLAAKKPQFMDELDQSGNSLSGRDGWLGKHNSVHAEKQLSFLKPNDGIAVNKAMCSDCQNFFRQSAKYLKEDQIVTDPDGSWLYQPDGTVIRPDGTIATPDALLNPPKTTSETSYSQIPGILDDITSSDP